MDQSLPDEVIFQLAKDIHPNHITALGVHLGFGLARIDQFKQNNVRDVLQAVIDMLYDFRDELCPDQFVVKRLFDALRKADSKDVARKLEFGEYAKTTSLGLNGSATKRKPTKVSANIIQVNRDKKNATRSRKQEGKTKGWGRKVAIRNIRPDRKASWHVHAKISSMVKPKMCSNNSLILKLVLDDGRDNIDAVGFYDDHKECHDIYGKLRVNTWYLFRNFRKVKPSELRYGRESDHKYELEMKSGTRIVPAMAMD